MTDDLNASVNPEVQLDTIIETEEDLKGVATPKPRYQPNGWPSWIDPKKVEGIRSLKIFEKVHEMILVGWTHMEIARTIHAEGEMLAVNEETVRAYITHYCATLPKTMLISRKDKAAVNSIVKKVEASLNAIEEMTALYRLQMERITMARKREDQLSFPMASVHKDILAAQTILKDIAAIQHGVIGGKYGQQPFQSSQHSDVVDAYDLTKAYTKETVQKVLNDPKKRVKVLDMVERMVDMYNTSQNIKEKPENIIDVETVEENKDAG
jgi:hypothetical protein